MKRLLISMALCMVVLCSGAVAHADPVLKAGWPVKASEYVFGSIVTGDIVGDTNKEIVAVSSGGASYYNGYVYAWDKYGNPLPGFPVYVNRNNQYLSNYPSPALADIDNDGKLEIVAAAGERVTVLKGNGSPLPGWPKALYTSSSPAISDINGDGSLDIVIGGYDNKIYAWDASGADLPGWPITTAGWVFATPALADIDNDGLPEVIVGSLDDYVHVRNGDGTPVAGWPKSAGGDVRSSAAVGDIDDDGELEVVVGTSGNQVYAWNANGTLVTGWPVATGGAVESSPALGDIDGDGSLEVVVGCFDDMVYAWNGSGSTVTGWPEGAGGDVYSSPSLVDLDNDNALEVAVGVYTGGEKVLIWNGDSSLLYELLDPAAIRYSSPTFDDIDNDGSLEMLIGDDTGWVYCWDFGAETYDPALLAWPMFHHDTWHTGLYEGGSFWFIIYPEKLSYRAGETLRVYVKVMNPGSGLPVEVKTWMKKPDGELLEIKKLSEFPLPAIFTNTYLVYSRRFEVGDPAGTYKLGAALESPITVEVFTRDAAEFTFTP